MHNAVWSPSGEGVEAGADAHSQAVLTHGLELHFQTVCAMLKHLIASPTALSSNLKSLGAVVDGTHSSVQATEVELVLPSLGIFTDWLIAYPEMWKEWWAKRQSCHHKLSAGASSDGVANGLEEFWSHLGIVMTALQHSYDAEEWHQTGTIVDSRYDHRDGGIEENEGDGDGDGDAAPRDISGSDSEDDADDTSDDCSTNDDEGGGLEGNASDGKVSPVDAADIVDERKATQILQSKLQSEMVLQNIALWEDKLIRGFLPLARVSSIREASASGGRSFGDEDDDDGDDGGSGGGGGGNCGRGDGGGRREIDNSPRSTMPSTMFRVPEDADSLQFEIRRLRVLSLGHAAEVVAGYLQFYPHSRVYVPVRPTTPLPHTDDGSDDGDSEPRPLYSPRTPISPWLPPLREEFQQQQEQEQEEEQEEEEEEEEPPLYQALPVAATAALRCADGVTSTHQHEPDGRDGAGAAVAAAADVDADADADADAPSSPTPFEKLHVQREMLKTQLETQAAVAAEQQQFSASVVASYTASAASATLTVRPRFLFPDTNCFLNMLGRVQSLMEDDAAAFKVMVPLTVVNELYSLTKGNHDRSSGDGSGGGDSGGDSGGNHSGTSSSGGRGSNVAGTLVERDGKSATLLEDVVSIVRTPTALTNAADAAVAFLEAEFASASPRIRAVTCMGTQMRSIEFRSETAELGKTNDDMILQSCAKFQAGMKRVQTGGGSGRAAVGGGPDGDDEGGKKEELYTAVLITGDTNLRLRAHALRVPAIGLVDFCQRVAKAKVVASRVSMFD